MKEYYIQYETLTSKFRSIFLTKEDCSKEKRIYVSDNIFGDNHVQPDWQEFDWSDNFEDYNITILTEDEMFLEMI